ncbi:MAG: hypothetical protein FWF03_05785 [Defluviitaleaceae bacterium]|nr:hypothetical protein [Defluviitaleaceae bacterium]
MNENAKPALTEDDEKYASESQDNLDPRQIPPTEAIPVLDEGEPVKKAKLEFWVYPALAPFAYIAMGMLFKWWAWGWIVIPVSAIVATPMPKWVKAVSLSPFAYILTGLFFGWWAWGWMIIPVTAILASGGFRRFT